MKPCENCHGAYVPKNGRQRWCPACAVAEIVCEWCRREFMVPRMYVRERRFCSKSCANAASARRGLAHENYNGGLTFNKHLGRWMIVCRDGTQMAFYRGVMAAHVGRLLESEELVHHRNEDPADDRLENLEITDRPGHARMHDFGSLGRRGPMGPRA